MKQIVINNVPADVHATLKEEAKANFRTIGQHLLALAFQHVTTPTPRRKAGKGGK